MGKVVSINRGQKQVARELHRKIQENKEAEKNAIPYSDWIRKMNNKFMIREAGNLFIQYKLEGMANEEAHFHATNQVKSEGIKSMSLEILQLIAQYNDGKINIEPMLNNIEVMAKDFTKQVEFIDRNPNNRFTHFLTDMEMLHDLSEEERENIINGKKE
jgi:hypothetical protein